MHFIKQMNVIGVIRLRISLIPRTEGLKKYSGANVFHYVRQAVLVQNGQLERFVFRK